MQAMNGSRSTELAASDVILDSNNTDISTDALPPATVQYTTTKIVSTPDPQNHLSNSLLQADAQSHHMQQPLQPLYEQGESGSEAGHHRPVPSWQQSEASMQEVASTSGSSESGTPSQACFRLMQSL